MAILVSLFGVKKAFAARPLFEGLTFSIESGERIGLIGPNGAGKSTLLRLIASQTSPDDGTLSFQRGLRVGFLEQNPSFVPEGTVHSTLLEGASDPHDWEAIAYAEELVSKLSLQDPSQKMDQLSGGWQKRVALGRELMRRPDLLLLDEPTNHLDLESIYWLEEWIRQSRLATLTITHDRAFLQKVSNRILELDRRNPGGILSVQGDYADFLETKEQWLASQERREVILKNTLRRETEWLRQGAKARTTKQQARIQRAGALKEEVEELQYRNQSRTVKLDFQGMERNPKKLIEAKGLSKSYGNRILFEGVDLILTPGKRVGILGANGCGKSTLIGTLLKEEDPDRGTVFHADGANIAYFQQNREALDPTATVAKTICPNGEFVDYRGERIHIRSYLDRFLFSQGQMDMAVGKLSGGEQGRLLIAQLMLRPANVLVLDEPTNDLDLATLGVLEECLTDFPGAILLVTHDRYFMDQVCHQILSFSGFPGEAGQVTSFSSMSQWENWFQEGTQKARASVRTQSEPVAKSVEPRAQESASAPKKRKLSFNEVRELASMETEIQKAEQELAHWTVESTKMENISHASKLVEITQKMTALQLEVDRLYARWSELEAKQS